MHVYNITRNRYISGISAIWAFVLLGQFRRYAQVIYEEIAEGSRMQSEKTWSNIG